MLEGRDMGAAMLEGRELGGRGHVQQTMVRGEPAVHEHSVHVHAGGRTIALQRQQQLLMQRLVVRLAPPGAA